MARGDVVKFLFRLTVERFLIARVGLVTDHFVVAIAEGVTAYVFFFLVRSIADHVLVAKCSLQHQVENILKGKEVEFKD